MLALTIRWHQPYTGLCVLVLEEPAGPGWCHPGQAGTIPWVTPGSLLSPPEKPGRDTGGPGLLEGARRHPQSRTDQGDRSAHRARKQFPGFAERAPGRRAPRRSSSLCNEGFCGAQSSRGCPIPEWPRPGGARSPRGRWKAVGGRPGWAGMGSRGRAGCDRVPLAQRADAQSERLSREVRALREERTELLHTASALRSDNDRQAGRIRHIQGTRAGNGAGSASKNTEGTREVLPKPPCSGLLAPDVLHTSACHF